jgi:hypothetical protein
MVTLLTLFLRIALRGMLNPVEWCPVKRLTKIAKKQIKAEINHPVLPVT